MKKILVLVSVFALAACSSKDKEEMPAEAAPAVTEAPMEAPAPVEEPAPAPAPDASVSDDGGESMPASGDFPSITGTERMTATCTSGGASRTVTVLDIADNGGCGVVYTKDSNPRTVAMAKNDMSYCDKVFENIKGNLSAGGMDCGDGGGAAAPAEPATTEEAAETPAAE